MLELKNVSKRVGNQVHLSDVSMRLEAGSLNVLLGPTLSGKTSLMRIMAGLDKPTTGSVFFDGSDVTGVEVQKRDVAMVYQTFINYPALSVYENIASPMKIARRPSQEIKDTVGRVAELLRLTPYLDRLPLQLSGGQQQRTALARALAKNAKLVLMDEPLANLDYKLREELRAELPKIFEGTGAIFVYATAEPEEALLLGGNTATLEEGRVTQFGPTVSVYRTPNTLSTARTFSDPPLNFGAVLKTGSQFVPQPTGGDAAMDAIPVPQKYLHLPDGKYSIAIRPHHLSLHPVVTGNVTLSGSVVATEITGSETYIHMAIYERWIMLTHGVHTFAPGHRVEFHFDRDKLMVFAEDERAVEAPSVLAA
ncbi:MAG: ABC transporter ATP-binding protein [Pseudomonadota bacterium]